MSEDINSILITAQKRAVVRKIKDLAAFVEIQAEEIDRVLDVDCGVSVFIPEMSKAHALIGFYINELKTRNFKA